MKTRQNITALIYDQKGNLLSIGKNSYTKTHPLQAKLAKHTNQANKIYLHAEIHAITRLKHYHKPYRIEIIRVNNQGEFLPSKPCEICQRAIKLQGIKHVEYTV